MLDLLNNSTPLNKNDFLEALSKKTVITWNKRVPNTQLEKFKKTIEKNYGKHFESYLDFHQWSVENYIDFWKEMWNYFNIITSRPYEEVLVKTGDGFLDNEWFSGARLNFAGNILRIRDNRLGLICADELENRETFTFAEIFEQVKLYAAAFRKHGLCTGDRVGCYMSNRKEAFFAMLATTSIGAMWSGVIPYYGARPASMIMNIVDPKIIITVDYFQIEGDPFYPIDNIASVAQNCQSVEKVIIVTTRKETLSRNISNIRNSIFLEDFLLSGRNPDGSVPEIAFEQLPFSHPTIMNFTSGTTGVPKGVVHSAGVIIAQMRDFDIHLNLKSGDVVYNHNPIGWAAWDYQIPSLPLGITQFLFEGSTEYSKRGVTIWENFSRNNVTYAFVATAFVDSLEIQNIIPDEDTNLDSLKIIALGGSPPKPRNYEFLFKKIKKDLFICSLYGSTEVFGIISGYDLNSPSYLCEVQFPALGVDLHCFDAKGNSVVGQRGELVITTPSPSFPIHLWKDFNNSKMHDTYFSKYEGVWTQNDECWINPKTKGIIVIGRSDDTLSQAGERFNSGDIYFAIDLMEDLEDYICVGQERWDGETRAVLFVKLKKGHVFTPHLKEKIETTITKELTEFYVPEVILEVPDIPYNITNKRMESVVKKIVAINKIPEVNNIKNPDSLHFFCDVPELIDYNKST